MASLKQVDSTHLLPKSDSSINSIPVGHEWVFLKRWLNIGSTQMRMFLRQFAFPIWAIFLWGASIPVRCISDEISQIWLVSYKTITILATGSCIHYFCLHPAKAQYLQRGDMSGFRPFAISNIVFFSCWLIEIEISGRTQVFLSFSSMDNVIENVRLC